MFLNYAQSTHTEAFLHVENKVLIICVIVSVIKVKAGLRLD